MKFKDLKKKKWVAYFHDFQNNDGDNYETQIIYDGQYLHASAEWEYDNGLYTETGTYPFIVTWKDLKRNMLLHKLPIIGAKWYYYNIYFYTGKCPTCGKDLTFKEFVESGTNNCVKCEEERYERLFPDEECEDL